MHGRDPELVIQQALRAQAGGPRRSMPDTAGPVPPAGGRGWLGRFTTTQVVLLAVLAGLVIGMAAGFVVLLG